LPFWIPWMLLLRTHVSVNSERVLQPHNWRHNIILWFYGYKNITAKRDRWADGAPKNNTTPETYAKHSKMSILSCYCSRHRAVQPLLLKCTEYISETCKWNLSTDWLCNSRLWLEDTVSCEAKLTYVMKIGDVAKSVTSDREIIWKYVHMLLLATSQNTHTHTCLGSISVKRCTVFAQLSYWRPSTDR
jgi:hypothetical protein